MHQKKEKQKSIPLGQQKGRPLKKATPLLLLYILMSPLVAGRIPSLRIESNGGLVEPTLGMYAARI